MYACSVQPDCKAFDNSAFLTIHFKAHCGYYENYDSFLLLLVFF
jgi:hypothetical protein